MAVQEWLATYNSNGSCCKVQILASVFNTLTILERAEIMAKKRTRAEQELVRTLTKKIKGGLSKYKLTPEDRIMHSVDLLTTNPSAMVCDKANKGEAMRQVMTECDERFFRTYR